MWETNKGFTLIAVVFLTLGGIFWYLPKDVIVAILVIIGAAAAFAAWYIGEWNE